MQLYNCATDSGKARIRVTAAVLLVTGAMLGSGCLVTAATIAVVHVIRSSQEETATVEVEATPRQVYDAMVRVVTNDPDIELLSKDDTQMTVSASRGEETASA